MDTFETELGITFKSQFSSAHVIAPENVNICLVKNSPNGYEFIGNYKNLNSFKFQDELGLTVLNMAKKTPGGLLIFVPSYYFLENLLKRWDDNGIKSEIGKFKEIYSEPRSSSGEAFDKWISRYQKKIFNSKSWGILNLLVCVLCTINYIM